MAHLPIEINPESIFILLSSLFISLILVTLILIKCMRHSTNPSVSFVNTSTTAINKITLEPSNDEKSDFSNSTKPTANIIIDESTLDELDTQSMPSDNKNASMMNLLQSHTRQSSFENAQSVSTENIIMPHVQKSNSLSTPRDKSVKSLDSATVVENTNPTLEKGDARKNKSNSVSRDNSPVPDYDEAKHADPFGAIPQNLSTQLLLPNSPNKSPLKQSLSSGSPSKKQRAETIAIQDPPELPARNIRLSSLPASECPTIKKPDANSSTEEVYECIQDEFNQLHIDTNLSPPSKTDDEDDPDNAYASVDQEKMKRFQVPPSLPAPRLPEHLKTSKELNKPPSAQDKKFFKKNRNSFHEILDNNTLTPEPTDTTDNTKKKAKSFTPFNKMRPSRKITSTELSADCNSKIARGALPPLPPTHCSDQDDTDEQYTCIETSPNQKHSRSSASSSSEDPYSELTFDPTKNRISKPTIITPDLIAVDYTHSDDGNTSPMEIDQPYSSIEEVKIRAEEKSLKTPSIEEGLQSPSPLSDSEFPPRALPQLPTEPKPLVPHQYVRPEVIKKRKEEHRKSKEQEKLLMEKPFIEEPLNSQLPIESENIQPSSLFPSLKSIFSDFRKEKDIVAENLSLVLGLPPPEPPNESDDETQSYASAAEVRERKAKKVHIASHIPNSESGNVTQAVTNESSSLDVQEPIFIGDIGDHTYSSLNETRLEANPYEEPKSVLESFTPTYEDPEEMNKLFLQKTTDLEPKSEISNEDSVDDENLGYETLQFNENEPKISPKVSQDLSKLREQKGYVKVSHQKDNMPEYASIDDFQKENNKPQIANGNSNNISVNIPTNTIQNDYTISSDILSDNEDKHLEKIFKDDY